MKQPLFSERKKLLSSIEKLLEGPMVFLGFVWLLLLIIELVWGLLKPLEYLSITIWIIFIFDFLIKFILAPVKLRFLKTNWLTAISLIIPALRIFRVLRLLRVIRGVRLVKVVASLNRGMKSLGATMKRRGFAYVFFLTLAVTFGGAAGMFAIEKTNPGFENYGMALWWTAMLIISIGSDYWPQTGEGRILCFLLSLYGFSIFGYITATLASFFIGRDAEEKDAPIASQEDVNMLQKKIDGLTAGINELKAAVERKSN